MTKANKKNLIIGGLLAIVLIMAVGYAAFATNLNINGSSAITSNWDVHIKDGGVNAKNPTQGAASTKARKVDALTGEFACTLQVPGTSSIEYDIEVENLGSFDATLDTVTISGTTEAVSAVVTEGSSLKQGGTIAKNGGTDTLTIKVSLNDISQLPSVTTIDITVKLDFSQATGSGGNTSESTLTKVYAYHTDVRTIGTSVVTDGVSDYTQLSSYKNGKTWFLKYDINEDNVIQNAYACMKWDFLDEPMCVQGYKDSKNNTYFIKNASYLDSYDSTFSLNGGRCSVSSSYGSCRIDQLDVAATSTGIVSAVDDSMNQRCSVGNGVAGCIE